MGYLSATDDLSPDGFRRATVLGSVMGSFCVEDFSADRLASLTRDEVNQRFEAFVRLTQFESFQGCESLPWRS